MKNFKKTFAIIGVVILIGLYLSTLIFALIDSQTSFMWFKVSVAATIFFPVILYMMALFYKQKNSSENQDSEEE